MIAAAPSSNNSKPTARPKLPPAALHPITAKDPGDFFRGD
jgi:hypothetical protein